MVSSTLSPPIFFSKSPMINKETPPKLREIIMDTWPQLYWLKDSKEKQNDNKHTTTTQNTGRKSGSTLTFNKDFSY
jgi:hypothetical protein